MRFYGREKEIAKLRHLLDAVLAGGPSRLAVVTGKRHIGKTTLLVKTFEEVSVPVFYCFAARTATEKNLGAAWASEFARGFGENCAPAADTPTRAIEYALSRSECRPCVILIDGSEALAAASPDFWPQMQTLWERSGTTSRTLLVFAGRELAMEKRFGGPATDPSFEPAAWIKVPPLPPGVLKQIFREEVASGSASDLLLLFTMTGGVPQRLCTLMDAGATTSEQALSFFYSEAGNWFRSEIEAGLLDEYRLKAPANAQILRTIASGATRWSEIQTATPARISPYMQRLEDFGLVRSIRPLLEHQTGRQVRYVIADPSLRFWLRFFSPVKLRTLAEAKHWDDLKDYARAALPVFLQLTLEEWLRADLMEKGDWLKAASWWDRKGENTIGIVAATPDDKRLLLGDAILAPGEEDRLRLAVKAERFFESHPELRSWHAELRNFSASDLLKD